MRKLLCLGIFFAVTSGCVSFDRQPASVSTGPELPLKTFARQQTDLVTDASYNSQSCAGVLSDLFQGLQKVDNWDAYSNEALTQQSVETIDALWQLRLALHQRLVDVTPACSVAIRNIFHRLRDDEDYLGEFAYHEPALDPAKMQFQQQARPIYDRKSYPPYLVRKDADDPKFKFKSGDLMLARGVSFISAIISQISTDRSQFSHVVFMNVDSKTDVPNTVESYIGVGVAPYKIDYALKNENARLLLLRPKDPALGERAAGFAMKAAAEHVPYDYSMNFKDYSAMSCVAVAVYSFDKASQGQTMIPMYPAQLNFHNADFLSKMHLHNGEMITPDDLEVDPRFDLILDWRDYRLTRDSREKDAVLAGMVHWINDLGYKFHSTGKSLFVTDVLRPARETFAWPLLKAITKAPDIDPRLPKDTLGLMTELNDVATNVGKELRDQDEGYFAAHQRPMTRPQLDAVVEKMRLADLQEYRQRGASSIHSVLRPDALVKETPVR